MPGIIQFLVDQFYTNQFMTAAVVAAPVTALTYAARSIPSSLWTFTKRNLSTDVRFNSDMHNYELVQKFVLTNVISTRWSRTFKYHAELDWDYQTDRQVFSSNLGVGYGSHFGWWQGRPVWVERSQQDGNATEKFKESLELTFLGRNTAALNDFVQAMEAEINSNTQEERVALYVNNEGSWERMANLPLRSVHTVFTNDQQAQRAVEHVRNFVARKDWYRQRGLPHHTGILFEGPPGTGKSSLIHAVASETKRNLFYLNLGGITEEKQLTALMADRSRWDNAALVVEDIDASGAKVNRDQKEGSVSLSTLLNLLDGILSPDGLVVLATTNHVEVLDPALVRPGRFDLVMQLGPLEWPQFQAMAALFDVSPARLQALQPVYRPTPGATLRALMLNPAEEGLEAYFAGQHVQLQLPGAAAPVAGTGKPQRGVRLHPSIKG